MRNHNPLIDRLSRGAAPVRAVWPTRWRVLAWLAAVLPGGTLTSWFLHQHYTDWRQPDTWPALVALVLSLTVSALAMGAAFNLSIAGRRASTLPGIALLALIWLALNLILAWPTAEPGLRIRVGEGAHCYLFMLCASVPMVALSIVTLRRTGSVHPRASLLLAGLACAFSASSLLSLCHEVQLHAFDFSMHLAAGLTIVVLTAALGRRWIGPPWQS